MNPSTYNKVLTCITSFGPSCDWFVHCGLSVGPDRQSCLPGLSHGPPDNPHKIKTLPPWTGFASGVLAVFLTQFFSNRTTKHDILPKVLTKSASESLPSR
jgi:hypothetical protein